MRGHTGSCTSTTRRRRLKVAIKSLIHAALAVFAVSEAASKNHGVSAAEG